MKHISLIQDLARLEANSQQNERINSVSNLNYQDGIYYGYQQGYVQCQKDNADKKYTIEDIKKAIELARESSIGYYAPGSPMIYYDKTYNEIVELFNPQD